MLSRCHQIFIVTTLERAIILVVLVTLVFVSLMLLLVSQQHDVFAVLAGNGEGQSLCTRFSGVLSPVRRRYGMSAKR